eukprot:5662611-Amphidinium_carterae.1
MAAATSNTLLLNTKPLAIKTQLTRQTAEPKPFGQQCVEVAYKIQNGEATSQKVVCRPLLTCLTLVAFVIQTLPGYDFLCFQLLSIVDVLYYTTWSQHHA